VPGTASLPRVRRAGATAWKIARFAFDTLIAPWPPFAVFLAVSAVLGAVVPLVQIAVTTELVDALGARHGGPAPAAGVAPPSIAALIEAAAPFIPWLVPLVGVLVLNRMIYFDPFHLYMASRLNERVRERFDRAFYAKALALRLERFESPAYYDALQRARTVMADREVATNLTLFGTLLTVGPRVGVILWALGAVHVVLPAVLLGGGALLLRWYAVTTLEMFDILGAQTALQRRRDYLRDLLTQRASAAEVRLFGLGGHLTGRWRRVADQLHGEQAVAYERRLPKGVALTAALVALELVVIAGLVLAAARGALTVGGLVALVYATRQYMGEIFRVGNRLSQLQRFFGELRYVADFFELGRGESAGGTTPPAPLVDGVRFERVSFTYPGGTRPALSDVSLAIRPGERVALVGENGAGKSTLAKLLLGLYEPTAGRVSVDGTDLSSVDRDAWRRRVGAVFQDFVRYALTARENVGFGRLELLHDDDAITRAAGKSSAAAAVGRLPDRWETLLGRELVGGHDLSRGQWQSLALARAYLRDAELLVLDEPTSALDARAELEVYRRFVELSAGKSVLLTSHRLGSARLADRIVCLQEGRVVEEGTHDELVAAGGPYAEMYRLQAEWYRDREEPDGLAVRA
jgi:ATP-binding cassette subfamily B protein